MPYKKGQPSLVQFIGIPLIEMSLKTSIVGKPYLYLKKALELCAYLYQLGAIIGLARYGRQEFLIEMFAVPGEEGKETISFIKQRMKKRLSGFLEHFGREPSTFDEFIMLDRIDSALKGIGLICEDKRYSYYYTDKEAEKVLNRKLPQDYIVLPANFCLAEGIIFGNDYYELTQSMYEQAKHDDDATIEMHTHALKVPDSLKIATLEEAQEAAIELIAKYVNEFYPELIDPLDLGSFIR